MKHNKYSQKTEATLDLHGMNSWEAEEAIEDFLDQASASGYKKVQIIPGKGLHSAGGAVLPEVVREILSARNLRFSRAKINDGGSGAVDVFL
jgi:DNA-nicking Smr family endonuclease